MQRPNDNRLIAKNTVLLYFRTLFVMFVSLYTSRVVLNILGVADYGIYQAVGGVVALFSVMSGALSNSISRFITFSLGKNDADELNTVFCISINIQVIISFIVVVCCELIGVWFLNNRMNIPANRLIAANWVLQCSLVSFVINLISTPYNACIIAHERMKAFAYVSILDAVLKLIIIYTLFVSPFDKLITYSILLVIVSLIIRIIYGVYCKNEFPECQYHFVNNKTIFRDMLSFASWNFFSNAAYILNTQGVSILINMYYGVILNAARGLATQVEVSIRQFVDNFSMAINPQITLSYANGDKERMNYLICKGARFSYFLLFIFCLPVFFEAEYILSIWLKNVPDYTVIFVRLALIGSLVTSLGTTGYTACMATGNIRRYVIWITISGSMVFFLTWAAYAMGLSVVATYWIYIVVYIIVQIVRLIIMKQLLDFDTSIWIQEVLYRIALPTILSIVPPLLFVSVFPQSLIRVIFVCIISIAFAILFIYLFGLTRGERTTILFAIKNQLLKKNVSKK